ncbi:Protein of unknown function [Gryllus bimaculatus]|nr:Protein of unknown function [Gryllus bimaculatus]
MAVIFPPLSWTSSKLPTCLLACVVGGPLSPRRQAGRRAGPPPSGVGAEGDLRDAPLERATLAVGLRHHRHHLLLVQRPAQGRERDRGRAQPRAPSEPHAPPRLPVAQPAARRRLAQRPDAVRLETHRRHPGPRRVPVARQLQPLHVLQPGQVAAAQRLQAVQRQVQEPHGLDGAEQPGRERCQPVAAQTERLQGRAHPRQQILRGNAFQEGRELVVVQAAQPSAARRFPLSSSLVARGADLVEGERRRARQRIQLVARRVDADDRHEAVAGQVDGGGWAAAAVAGGERAAAAARAEHAVPDWPALVDCATAAVTHHAATHAASALPQTRIASLCVRSRCGTHFCDGRGGILSFKRSGTSWSYAEETSSDWMALVASRRHCVPKRLQEARAWQDGRGGKPDPRDTAGRRRRFCG